MQFVPDCYENQKVCNKPVDNYPHALEFVLECYNTPSFTIQFVPECYKTQGISDKVFNQSFLAFFYILNQYKTQEMC